MVLLAIDPGTSQSAFLVLDTDTYSIIDKGKVENDVLIGMVKTGYFDMLVIEWIQNYGARLIGGKVVGGAGQSVFETCRYVGRIQQIALDMGSKVELVYRTTIKAHITGKANANDKQVRSCLLDRYGEKGTKSKPGILYGVNNDMFSALAVATYWVDKEREMRKI